MNLPDSKSKPLTAFSWLSTLSMQYICYSSVKCIFMPMTFVITLKLGTFDK